MENLGSFDISITAIVGVETQIEAKVDFILNILDPCIDTNFVNVVGQAPDDKRYVVSTYS